MARWQRLEGVGGRNELSLILSKPQVTARIPLFIAHLLIAREMPHEHHRASQDLSGATNSRLRSHLDPFHLLLWRSQPQFTPCSSGVVLMLS